MPEATKVVSGVTIAAPAGARNWPTNANPVSALVPPEAKTPWAQPVANTKLPLRSV